MILGINFLGPQARTKLYTLIRSCVSHNFPQGLMAVSDEKKELLREWGERIDLSLIHI